MDLYTCNINSRENVDENNKMYLFWTSTDDRVDKLDHFVPLTNDLNPPPLKQTKYVKREVYVPVTTSLLEGIFMDIGKKRSSPEEHEISCKKRKVCNVGNKQITATASMKPDLSKDVSGLQSFLSMHQEGPTYSKKLPDGLSTNVKSKIPVTSESIKKYFTPVWTSNKVPLSVISLYKDIPVLSGDNMLNDRPVESCIKVQPKDNSITLTNEGVPINVTHPTGILVQDCNPFDIGQHVNTKKSVEENVELSGGSRLGIWGFIPSQ